jgi:hypothetical protein
VNFPSTLSPREHGSSERRPLPRAVWAFLVALYAVCVGACWLTRDFGYYFDDKLHVEALRVTYESGVPLPRYYHYPSFSYLVSLLASVPSWIAAGCDGAAFASDLGAALQRKLVEPTPRTLLDARAVFAAVAHLGLFWAALVAWRLSHSRLAACVAALALGASFEFHYHARIWSTDAMMAQFVLLAVLCALRYFESARRRDLLIAAAVAGVAAGTKFPGAMALTALGVAALAHELRVRTEGEFLRGMTRVAGRCVLALLVLVAVFLVTTPGVLFDYGLFHEHVSMELRHYRAEGKGGLHEPYGVAAGWDHFSRQVAYLAVQALSYAPPAALCLFLLALVGAFQVARRQPVAAAVAFSVPLLYVAYFSYQRLMVVRNFQVLLGFAAVAVGIGAHALWTSTLPRPLRVTLLSAAAVALAWNALFLVHADRTILGRREFDAGAAVREFAAASSSPLFLAPRVRELAGIEAGSELARRLADDVKAARYVLVMPADLAAMVARPGFRLEDVRANWPRIYQPLPQGPWEVNYSYYPTWVGDARPLLIAAEYYRALTGEK